MKATIETDLGTIELELDEKKAPATVKNFADYAKSGHYNDTIFHRVIDGFMIHGLKNARGTIAMARTMVVDSATSQFFINLVDNGFLDFRNPTPQGFGYAVFGKVTKGMEVVDKIAKVQTGNRGMHQDVPVKPVVIKKVTVEEAAKPEESKKPEEGKKA